MMAFAAGAGVVAVIAAGVILWLARQHAQSLQQVHTQYLALMAQGANSAHLELLKLHKEFCERLWLPQRKAGVDGQKVPPSPVQAGQVRFDPNQDPLMNLDELIEGSVL